MKNHGSTADGKYVMRVRKAITHEDGTRTCSLCEKRLPIEQFHKDKASPDGFRSRCKECRIKHVKNWYQENKDRQSTKEKIRRQSNPEKYAEKEAERYIRDREKRINLATEHSHRRKARKLQTVVERGISKKSLKKKFGTKCYYCSKEMDFSVGAGRKFNQDMATIEHLIPLARGGEHTWENTVLACRNCNISKNAKTEEEFEKFKSDKSKNRKM
jgi:5-methylcytosine-specific restriction endonuclease McrA